MEAIRYIQKITSDSLIIKDLGKYLGQQVEIIIFPLEQDTQPERPYEIKRVRGFLHKYANPPLIEKEKSA